MEWNWYFKVALALLFFMSFVVIGSNISAQKLAIITDEQLTPPFLIKKVSKDIYQLEIIGEDYQYSLLPIKRNCTNLKASIQNTAGAVKCNLAPRLKFLRVVWSNGVEKMKSDLQKIVK